MQKPSGSSQVNKDGRANSMEDSPMLTIEYLRGRLLAERSASKAAKERSDELARQVTELEDQLKVVTLQRKRAEKATLDVLSFLASHGISDISEIYESESDQEESLGESNVGEHDTTKEEENYGFSELKENDKEFSGSDHESTPSSSRSLSWKGCKENKRQFENISVDSSIKRRTSLAQVLSSPRHHSGKSCRQIKRRELRSAVQESRHTSNNSGALNDNALSSSDSHANCLDRGDEELQRFPEERVHRSFPLNEASQTCARECDGSGSCKLECHGEVDAQEHQALLIGRYEAQEKAQRDWEEQYGDTNIGTPDSCEPGNHSDVTEERDENKATVACSAEIVAEHGLDLKAGMETHFKGTEPSITHFNSSKLTPHTDTGRSQNHNFREMKTSTSSATDFAFSVVNRNQKQECGERPSFQSSSLNPPNLERSAGSIASPLAGSSFCESEPAENMNRDCALIPHEGPHGQRLGAVLGALHDAKSMLKQQIHNFPLANGSVVKPIESPLAIGDGDWFKGHIGCPGLFRVPTDILSQTSQGRLLGSDYSSELANLSLCSGTSVFQGSHHTSRPINPRLSFPSAVSFSSRPIVVTKPCLSNRNSRFDVQFNISQLSSIESAFRSYSSAPDLYQVPSNLMFSSPDPRRESGMPSSGSPLYYDHDVRSNMFR